MTLLTRDQISAALADPNVRAFLRVIRQGESGQGDAAYRMRYGGAGKPPAYFDGFADHPRIFEPTPTGERSSAAGAYQITATTWSALWQQYGFPDFSPASQDAAAVALLHECGALERILAGDLDGALKRAGRIWASLPGSPLVDGGTKQSVAAADAVYESYGGRHGTQAAQPVAVPAEAPAEAPPAPPAPDMEEHPMALGTLAALGLDALTGLVRGAAEVVPEVGKLLLDPSKSVPQRNVEAAGVVLQKIAEATRPASVPPEAWNEQAAVAAVRSDPAAAAKARAAVLDSYERVLGMMLKAAETEEASRDKAAARARTDTWDMLPFLADRGFKLMAVALGVQVVLLAFGFWQEVSNEALMILLTLLVTTLGKLVDRWGQMYDYRIGSSAGSKVAGDALRDIASTRR